MKEIVLPADLDNDLSWKKEALLAEKEENVFWKIDFPWKKVSLLDKQTFVSFALVLEHFTKTLCKENAVGVCLYEGSGDFAKQFSWEGKAQENFREWAADMGKEHRALPFDFQVFCANVFGEYLQRLSSFLPESLPVHARFTDLVSPILLSSERFAHIKIERTNGPTAICLPSDELLCSAVIEQIHELMEEGNYKLIPEALLTEEWDEIDKILVFPDYVSPLGKRKLQGFEASGGVVVNQTVS